MNACDTIITIHLTGITFRENSMQARSHVAASIIASATTYAVSDSATMAAAALFSGICIDADHLIDYVVLHRPPYSIGRFFHTFYQSSLTHVLLVLHSWELIGILALVAIASDWEPLTTGLLIGMGHHLLLDQIFNHANPLGYFLTFRLIFGLSYTRCFRRTPGTVHNKKKRA
jgi:hypothetical protein